MTECLSLSGEAGCLVAEELLDRRKADQVRGGIPGVGVRLGHHPVSQRLEIAPVKGSLEQLGETDRRGESDCRDRAIYTHSVSLREQVHLNPQTSRARTAPSAVAVSPRTRVGPPKRASLFAGLNFSRLLNSTLSNF